jgi:hypothetical protein
LRALRIGVARGRQRSCGIRNPALGKRRDAIRDKLALVISDGDRAGDNPVGIRRRRMTKDEETQLKTQLERLRQEHRDLDAAIEALQTVPGSDILQVQRLKKRKLALRDRIGFIEDQLTPDIIA